MTDKNKRYGYWALSVSLIAFLIGASLWNAETSSGITADEGFKQQIRNGLAEINLPTNGDVSTIDAASTNLVNFVLYRSGVQIAQNNIDSLRVSELASRNQSKYITPSQLSQILTDVVIERIPNLSNADVSAATETLRGFNAPDLSAGFQQGRNYVKLRANGDGTMSASTFQTEVTNYKNGGMSRAMQSAISNRIALEVERKINLISDASPQYFGDAKSRLSPMQAMLITYSVVTDDPLAYNQTGLEQRMHSLQQGIATATGQSHPSPQNHRAYGDNGYLYSSPAGLLLNTASISRIVELINERGNIQQ